jgi:glutamyl/glutaminyl-tRNA synthetase
MSKRHGPTSLTSFIERGYLKEALINYLAMLGWNPGDDREIFNLDELIKEFNIEKVSKSGAIFDEERLNWYNREYLKKIDDFFDNYETILCNALKQSESFSGPFVDVYKVDNNKILEINQILDNYKTKKK